MDELKLEDWLRSVMPALPTPPHMGPPLPRFLGIYWPWYKPFIGFTLRIVNAPAGAVLWNANFAEHAFGYEPMADSGWLGIDESWNYPSDPRGCTTLKIWALDADNNILFDVGNLGPVNNGKNYVYDCATGILSEA